MKLYAPCEVCEKRAFFIRKRKVTPLTLSKVVVSKKQMCGTCYRKVLEALTPKK